MRKTMMATASALALVLGTAAFADQATDATQQEELHLQEGAGAEMEGGATGAGGTTADGGATAADSFGVGGMGGQSYADFGDEDREGVTFADTAGDWDADELIGTTVVDAEGEEIGEIEDLIVGDDQSIDRAVIRVSSEDGEERFVTVSLQELQRAEGDAGEELTLDRQAIEGDYFGGDSSFEKQDGRWEPSAL